MKKIILCLVFLSLIAFEGNCQLVRWPSPLYPNNPIYLPPELVDWNARDVNNMLPESWYDWQVTQVKD